MRKCLVGIGLVLCIYSPAGVQASDREAPGKGAVSGVEQPARTGADACDCCQKCKEAKGSIRPKVAEGVPKGDPCTDCCNACGTPAPPVPQEMPPELIEKRVQPEGKGK